MVFSEVWTSSGFTIYEVGCLLLKTDSMFSSDLKWGEFCDNGLGFTRSNMEGLKRGWKKWEKNPRVSTQCPHIFCINCIRSYCHLVNSVTLKSYNKSKEYMTLIPCQHIIIWTTKTFFFGGGVTKGYWKI